MTERAKEYLDALQEAINNDATDDIIGYATQMLNFLHDDPDILTTRAIGYINNGTFDLALADLEKVKGADFERIYCIYSLKRFREALDAINALPAQVQSEERYLHLKGQCQFSLDLGRQCFETYQKINIADATEEDLVNISASMALCGMGAEASKLVKPTESQVQQVYNTAIALYEAGQYEECDRMIDIGNELAARAAEQEAAEEEEQPEGERFLSTEEQMLHILRADILAQTKPQEASAIFDEMSENEKAHVYARQVAASNYVTLNIDSGNTQALKKKISQFEDNNQFPALRKCEQEAFLINRVLVYGKSNKATRLVQLARDNSRCDQLVLESFSRIYDITIPESQNAPIFDAQTLISDTKFEDAAQVLLKSTFAKRPRCISVIAELYCAANKPEDAIRYLHGLSLNESAFYQFAIQFAFDRGFSADAAKWAELNTKVTANNPLSQALMALALSETDIEMAERYAGRLKVDISGINVAELEAAALQSMQSTDTQLTGFDVKQKKKKRPIEQLDPDRQEKRREKHRRRRRLQLPVNFDKARPANPARWQKKKKLKKGRRQQPAKMGKIGVNVSAPVQAPVQAANPIAAAAAKQQSKAKSKSKGKGGKKKDW